MAMEKSSLLLALLVVLYLIIVILGFPQAVGIGLAVTRLNGCPLFSEITNRGPYPALFGSLQHCNYVTFMPVIVSIVFGIIMFIYHAYGLFQALRRPGAHSSHMPVTPFIVTSLIGLVLTVIGAGLLEGGLYWFCISNRVLAMRFLGVPVTCTTGEATVNLFRGYDPYYDLLATEATYWLSVIAWAAVLLTTILRAVMLRRERSNGDELRDPNRPAGDIFRGVTLISDKFKKRTNEPVAPTKVIHAERTPMAQFETKIKPLETAA